MELETLLGTDLYSQVKSKIDETNAKETDKLKHVRFVDLSEGGYISKAKYDAEKANLEEQLKTLNATIKTLKTENGDNEELQKTINKLQEDLKNQQKANVDTLKTYALKEQLAKEGVLDPDYLIYKAGGIDKFTFDKENRPVGVADTVKPYKEDEAMAHLFKQEQQKPPYHPQGGAGASADNNPFAKDTFNLTEQGKLLKDNPEQARALAAAAGVTI